MKKGPAKESSAGPRRTTKPTLTPEHIRIRFPLRRVLTNDETDLIVNVVRGKTIRRVRDKTAKHLIDTSWLLRSPGDDVLRLTDETRMLIDELLAVRS
jgi:hypothetical protein